MTCEHVFKVMGAPFCPECGKRTHEIEWDKAHQAHKEWIESGKAVQQGWWSI